MSEKGRERERLARKREMRQRIRKETVFFLIYIERVSENKILLVANPCDAQKSC